MATTSGYYGPLSSIHNMMNQQLQQKYAQYQPQQSYGGQPYPQQNNGGYGGFGSGYGGQRTPYMGQPGAMRGSPSQGGGYGGMANFGPQGQQQQDQMNYMGGSQNFNEFQSGQPPVAADPAGGSTFGQQQSPSPQQTGGLGSMYGGGQMNPQMQMMMRMRQMMNSMQPQQGPAQTPNLGGVAGSMSTGSIGGGAAMQDPSAINKVATQPAQQAPQQAAPVQPITPNASTPSMRNLMDNGQLDAGNLDKMRQYYQDHGDMDSLRRSWGEYLPGDTAGTWNGPVSNMGYNKMGQYANDLSQGITRDDSGTAYINGVKQG